MDLQLEQREGGNDDDDSGPLLHGGSSRSFASNRRPPPMSASSSSFSSATTSSSSSSSSSSSPFMSTFNQASKSSAPTLLSSSTAKAKANGMSAASRDSKKEGTAVKQIPDPIVTGSEGLAQLDVQHSERVKMDEFKYLLDGLLPRNPKSVRIASGLKLCTLLKDADASFLIRANGGFARIFEAVPEASSDRELASMFSCVSYTACLDPKNVLHVPVSCFTQVVHIFSSPSMKTLAGGASSGTADTSAKTSATAKRRALLSPLRKSNKRRGRRQNGKDDGFKAVLGEEVLHNQPFTPAAVAGRVLSLCADQTDFVDKLLSAGDDLLAEVLDRVSVDFDTLSGDPTAEPSSLASLFSSIESGLHVMENISHLRKDAHGQLLDTCDKQSRTLVTVLLHMIRFYWGELKKGSESLQLGHTSVNEALQSCCRVLVNLTNQSDRGCRAVLDHGGIRLALEMLHTSLSDSPVGTSFDVTSMCLGIVVNCAEHSRECCNYLASECELFFHLIICSVPLVADVCEGLLEGVFEVDEYGVPGIMTDNLLLKFPFPPLSTRWRIKHRGVHGPRLC